jgi:bacterial/archaeal transporter family protein
MKTLMTTWQFWALASAFFAAMTAILAKIGVTQINSDFATLIRTVVILLMITAIVTFGRAWQPLDTVPSRSLVFLILSGLATGASWLCYFRALKLGDASRVAPIDKLSVVMVAIFAVLFLGENLTLPNWLGVVMIAGGTILLAWRG